MHACRSEAVPALIADVVTARAVAPLPLLLDLAGPFIGPATCCLFLKGRSAAAELTAARRQWRMHSELHPSLSASDGHIVVLRQVTRE